MAWPALDQREALVARLPAAFTAWEVEPEQLPVGAPGKVGVLRLEFARRGEKTRLALSFATGPQRLQRALYLDPCVPGMAFGILQSVSGGVLQGDRLATFAVARDAAQVHLTTQAATKVYRMDRNYATSRLVVTVEPGAYLEYLPDFLIPFRSARFYQEVDLRVADEGTLVWGDLIAPGRVASGEVFRFDLVCTRLQARNLRGDLRASDYVQLQPAKIAPTRPGLLAGSSYYGSLLVLSKQVRAEELVAAMYEALAESDVVGGASCLPHDDGAVLRVLGPNGAAVEYGIHAAWSTVRALLLGSPGPDMQRLKYGFPSTNAAGA